MVLIASANYAIIMPASAQRYSYFVTTFCVPNCLTSLMSMAVYQLKRTEPVRFAEVIFCPKGLCFRVFLLAEF